MPIHRNRLVGWASVASACVIAGIFGGSLSAQEPTLGPLTLVRVLELAEARSESVESAQAGVRRAEGEQLRVRSGLLPQLSGAVSYDRTLQSEFEGVFDGFTFGGGAPCNPFLPDRGAAIADRIAEIERVVDCGAGGENLLAPPAPNEPITDGGLEDLPFGQANAWRVNLSFSQNLYSGGRIGAQTRAAAIGLDSAGVTLATTRAQLLFDVTQAYYEAVLGERLVRIAEATVEQADATFRQVQAGFRAGTQPEFEVLRAQVTRDSQQPGLIRQRANHELAQLRLRQLLDLPADYNLQLADSLDDGALPPSPVFAERMAAVESLFSTADAVRVVVLADIDSSDRSAVREISLAVQAREAAAQLTRAQRMPSVTVTSAYGQIAYPSGAYPSFGDFRSNWTIGASVQFPILTGGRQRADELVAEAELQQARAQLRQIEELAALDAQTAWTELVAARATWEATVGTIEQATRAYAIAEVRYGAGVSTQLELSDSRLQLQQAEANRAQAARDYQVARARVALLEHLPLGVTGAGGGQAAPQAAPVTPQQPAQQGGAAQFVTAAQTQPAGGF